jgi:hypothetical protein
MTEHKGRGRSPTQAERRHLPDGFGPRWGLYEVRHTPVHVPQSDTQIGGAETWATSRVCQAFALAGGRQPVVTTQRVK